MVKSVTRNDEVFYRNAVADAFRQCHFIGIFKFATEGYATGNGCDLYRKLFKFFADIIYSCIALYGWAECKNDLFNFFFSNAVNQGING